MVRRNVPEKRRATDGGYYECYECGYREVSDSHLRSCPECGGEIHNISVPRE
ncbi:rubrerythrin-like domain-containing protein [Haloferacaceae archaeon DSL9]